MTSLELLVQASPGFKPLLDSELPLNFQKHETMITFTVLSEFEWGFLYLGTEENAFDM